MHIYKKSFNRGNLRIVILAGLIFDVLSNNCIWWYINLLYNLQCSLRDWWGFNLVSSEKITKSPNFNPSQNFYSYGIYIAILATCSMVLKSCM